MLVVVACAKERREHAKARRTLVNHGLRRVKAIRRNTLAGRSGRPPARSDGSLGLTFSSTARLFHSLTHAVGCQLARIEFGRSCNNTSSNFAASAVSPRTLRAVRARNSLARPFACSHRQLSPSIFLLPACCTLPARPSARSPVPTPLLAPPPFLCTRPFCSL